MKGAIVGLCCAVLAAQAAIAQDAPSKVAEVSASGRGEVSVAPNRAILVVTVENNASSAGTASAENARLVASTMASLRAAGATEAQLTNGGYSLNQDYENGDRRRPRGFVARNSIRIDIPRVADIGRMIDAGIAGGATIVSPIQFRGPDMPNARRDALKAAVAQARLDAESMAEAAGGSLGRLIVLSTGMAQEAYAIQDMGVQLTSMREQVGVPTSIRPTDLAVVAVATGRWEFVPKH